MPKGYQLHDNDPVDTLDGIRPLTTQERAMIQTFPEDFCFLGSKSDQEQMIGNAVPVNLGQYVGRAIMRKEGINNALDLSSEHRITHANLVNPDDQFKDTPTNHPIQQPNLFAPAEQHTSSTVAGEPSVPYGTAESHE